MLGDDSSGTRWDRSWRTGVLVVGGDGARVETAEDNWFDAMDLQILMYAWKTYVFSYHAPCSARLPQEMDFDWMVGSGDHSLVGDCSVHKSSGH